MIAVVDISHNGMRSSPRRFTINVTTPERLTIPLNQWLPSRYRVAYTWPVESQPTSKDEDGITLYNKSRAVDEPFIATRSTDGQWIMATFSLDQPMP